MSNMLNDREFGFELSGFEYSLLFEHDNIGFVRIIDKRRQMFCLDPSPFLKAKKNDIYVVETQVVPLPDDGILIEVLSLESEKVPISIGAPGNYEYQIIKYVRDWQPIDPQKIIPRKQMSYHEFTNFFIGPFIGDRDNIEQLATCMALYSVSTPQEVLDGKGGLTAAIQGRKEAWSAFKRIMNFIPRDFKNPSSNFYYSILDKDSVVNPTKSKEITLAYNNPTKVISHLPVSFNVETREVSAYEDLIKDQIPLIRAYMLDSLLYQPKIPDNLDSYIIEEIYTIQDNVKKAGKSLPFEFDLGATVPKISTSVARLHHDFNATKNDIKRGMELWHEMFDETVKMSSTGLSMKQIYKLSINARQLYAELEDNFGTENHISKIQITNNTKLSDLQLEEALNELRKHALIYSPQKDQIKLLDLRD